MEPAIRIGHGINGFLVFSRVLSSQLLPRVRGVRYVLDGADSPCRVLGLEVERTEVDRVIGQAIQAMKRNPDETLLLNILAPDIKLESAIGELDALQVRHTVAGAFTNTEAFLRSVVEGTYGAVIDLQAFPVGKRGQIRLDRFLLTEDPANTGECEGAAEGRDYKITSLHDFPFVFILIAATLRSCDAECANDAINERAAQRKSFGVWRMLHLDLPTWIVPH
jgi:hypothetical protein